MTWLVFFFGSFLVVKFLLDTFIKKIIIDIVSLLFTPINLLITGGPKHIYSLYFLKVLTQ